MKKIILLAMMMVISYGASAQREVEVVETPSQSTQEDGLVLKRKVAIGRFSNETQYAKGIFYDKENDPMGKQALDILSSKLATSEKFLLLERNDLATLLEECQKGQNVASTVGADYMIIGSITEYGRKNIGKDKVFSSEKTQMVEAAVSIRFSWNLVWILTIWIWNLHPEKAIPCPKSSAMPSGTVPTWIAGKSTAT